MESIKKSLEKERLEERQKQDTLDAKIRRISMGHRALNKPETIPNPNGNRKERRAFKATHDKVVLFGVGGNFTS